jgi:octaprenyl-diphosphate synthase
MGAHFGLAVQIIGDLLDYEFGSKNLDKAKFTDLSNGLITLPLLYYFEDCSAEERAEMESLIKRVATDDVAGEIIARLNAKKSFEKAKAEAQEHLEQALQIADKFPKNNFTDEIVAMFASMSDRGN